jgi:hypothetical protein
MQPQLLLSPPNIKPATYKTLFPDLFSMIGQDRFSIPKGRAFIDKLRASHAANR